MRRASHSTQWLLGEDGQLLGLALGFDFCAEHESGTRPLQRQFGIMHEQPEGLAQRRVQHLPDSFLYGTFQRRRTRGKHKQVQPCALLARERGATLKDIKTNHELGFWSEPGDRWHESKHDLVCAWSDEDFAILVRGKEQIQKLAELHAAFLRHDILFGAGFEGGFAAHRGLTFVIDSRVSDEERAKVLEADLDYTRLLAAAASTGIEARLKAANRGWYALTPRWEDESHTAVRFWLNPMQQDRFNHGWYSVADLEEWANGSGPVIKALESCNHQTGV